MLASLSASGYRLAMSSSNWTRKRQRNGARSLQILVTRSAPGITSTSLVLPMKWNLVVTCSRKHLWSMRPTRCSP